MLRKAWPLQQVTGKKREAWKESRIQGTAVLVNKEVLDISDYRPSFHGIQKTVGKHGVSFSLVSATAPEPSNVKNGKMGRTAHLDEMVVTMKSTLAGESVYKVTFEWDQSQGIPGAVIVRNNHRDELLLKTLTLDGVPGKGTVVFVANSWISPSDDRVFFANDTYLPSKMPALLVRYRQNELKYLRGDRTVGDYNQQDRAYHYDYYNDLGDPERGWEYARPVLGGGKHPYPRRGRTGRHPAESGPLGLLKKGLEMYVPRDERFGHLKLSDFLGCSLKAITESILPIVRTYVDTAPAEFDSFQDINNLYGGLLQLPHSPELEDIRKKIPLELIKSILPVAGEDILNLPLPRVIESEKLAWRTDEEFAREMLAGVNPVCIKRVTEFPVKSTLGFTVYRYGDQSSKITEDQIQPYLEDGITVSQALESNRL